MIKREYKPLRTLQLEAVLSMLNLNKPKQQQQQELQEETLWRVLIYDVFGQEVISPLLRISDLRENGITLHMLLVQHDHQPIPDVPAIYFIQPTVENIQILCQDLKKNLYSSYYINFSSVVSRDLLEMLAQSSLESGSYSLISQVYDQYLNYMCLKPHLFSCNLKDSYVTLNHPQSTDTQIEQLVRNIVDSLFSVFITNHQIPIIRCPRGNAAEQVAMTLESKLKDHVRNSRHYQEQEGSRPVLIILDRNMDLSVMLQHTWYYQCLAHDVLEMKSNRISFVTEEQGRQVKKSYDLDLTDFFWAKNAQLLFPHVAASVNEELNKYKQEVSEITKKFGVDSLDQIAPGDASNAMYLKTAMEQLPKLTQRKRIIDMHTNILSTLFQVINQRKLDLFVNAEDSLQKQTKVAILDLIKRQDLTKEDQLRLVLVYYLSLDHDRAKAEVSDLEAALKSADIPVDALTYLKNTRAISAVSRTQVQIKAQTNSPANKTSELLGMFTESTGFGNALDSIISGVKNILPSSKNLPITRIVENLMDGNSTTSSLLNNNASTPDDEYLFLDPKALKPLSKKQGKSMSRNPFQEAYVFVVGGGNYVEYQNLQEYCSTASGDKKITYGSTEILNAKTFLKQLETLGSFK